MRSEKELRDFLEACNKASGFGLSEGPCPLKVNEKKDCEKYCSYDRERIKHPEIFDKDIEKMKKECCEQFDEHKGCCSECSFPSAIVWVLGASNDPTDNGQNRLINAMKGEI